ncbi:MAG TPA: hypothetical protein VF710_11680 [Longimicrobium sp.]
MSRPEPKLRIVQTRTRERVGVRRLDADRGDTAVQRSVERGVKVAPDASSYGRVQRLKALDSFGCCQLLTRRRIHHV